jgi:NAD(P)-dependent dehydrogenase (short-subunit alcohol dehydrogenase family)
MKATLTDRSVVIISGAAGGIGRAAVRRFSEAGYAVLAFDIDRAVEQLSARQNDPPILGIVADHERLDAIEAAVAASSDFGALRHIVAFAGVALPEELVHDDLNGLIHPSLFRATIERNLMGHVNLLWAAQHALFKTDGDRSVTLCSSINAVQTWGEPGYSTAKAALIGLVRSLAGPFGRRGVRINALSPGTIDSSGARSEYRDHPGRFELMRGTVPLGRLGEVDDVADAALAIARNLRHMHGAVLTLDGGQTIERSWQLA